MGRFACVSIVPRRFFELRFSDRPSSKNEPPFALQWQSLAIGSFLLGERKPADCRRTEVRTVQSRPLRDVPKAEANRPAIIDRSRTPRCGDGATYIALTKPTFHWGIFN